MLGKHHSERWSEALRNPGVLNLAKKVENLDRVAGEFEPFQIACFREIGVTGPSSHAACTKGHLRFVKKAKDAGLPCAFLFEDDCQPCSAMGQWGAVAGFLERNSGDWDLFYGGATMVHPVRWICGFRNPGVEIVECRHALAVHFVVYNESSYERALGWFDLPQPEEARPAIDTWLTRIGLRIWTTTPALAVQRPSFSNSLGMDVDYSGYFERANAKLEHFVGMRRGSLTYRLLGKFLRKF